LEGITERERLVQLEAEDVPDDGAVRQSLAAITAAEGTVGGLQGRLQEMEIRVADSRRELQAALDERDHAAADLGISNWANDPQALEDGVADYLLSLAEFWPAVRASRQAESHAATARQRAEETHEDLQRRSESLHQIQLKTQAAVARLATLEASMGVTVENVLQRLEEARLKADGIRREREQAAQRETELRVAVALAGQKQQMQSEILQRDSQLRDAAAAALSRRGVARLLPLAVPELGDVDSAGWSIDDGVAAASRIAAALAEINATESAWERSQKTIHRSLQELTEILLPQGYEPHAVLDDGILVVTVPFQGESRTMAELGESFSTEVHARHALLNAREREVLEGHLIGEIASHLQQLVQAGEALVRQMNDEVMTRPMSTGMSLRFVWRPAADGPEGFSELRKKLLSGAGGWSPAERDALGAFLQQRIQVVRTADEAGTWHEHLMHALDYRRWHEFGVERQQEGQWKRLTRRTHGTGSGGEKAIALTIPQFAAAAAHYSSADRLAPRLILLDEAFVGIDADMRSKCMGLLQAFDLDFVMTSEREWGCYATLAGLAIYQLATRPGIDAVHVTRWVWNGQQCVRDLQPLPNRARPNEIAMEDSQKPTRAARKE
jgi:uncharacterized protein (TIGR02680 family)